MRIVQLLKGMKCVLKARRMSKEQKLESLREKYAYIQQVLIPRIPTEDRAKATMKIQAKYNKLVKKIEKGK